MHQLLEDIEHYVRTLFSEYCGESFYFHNISHTEKVVSRTTEIAGHMNLNTRDAFSVTAAAWFHDTGYLFVLPAVHEEKSTEIMLDFMSGKIADEDTAIIAGCIMATKYSAHPDNLLQQIICDADTYHFGTPEFSASNEKVFLEFRAQIPGLDKETFNRETISMLIRHQFYTPYCEALLMAGKQRNLDMLLLNYY